MKCALVTGTSSGIGLAIARKLLQEGYLVYGLSRTSSELNGEANFIEYLMDLTDLSKLNQLVTEEILVKSPHIDLLVNNAGCGYYGPHETLSGKAISEMVTTNVTVPMLLTNLLIRSLRESHGTIVQISSYTANQTNPHGAAYGATKAALSSFATGIYEENRKQQVRMIVMEPEMTATNLYRNADFTNADEEGAYLDPEEIATLLSEALSHSVGYQRITLQPQYRRIARKN